MSIQNSAHTESSAPASDDGFQAEFDAHRRGALEAAVAGYRRVVTASPEHLDAWSNLCVALLAMGRAEEAAEAGPGRWR